jgi:uncharacterized protein YabE (DUF348 family)
VRIPKSTALYVSAAVVALVGGSAATATAAHKTITVQDNGQRKLINGFTMGNLGAFLSDKNVGFSGRDRVSPSLSSEVQNGMTVVIEHPLHVTLMNGMVTSQVETFASTVGEFIKQQGIALGPDDKVDSSTDATVTDGETIQIQRISKQVDSKTEETSFQTIRQRTDKLYTGQQRVLTHGVKGLLETQTTSVFVNGHKTGQTVTKKVVKKPVNEVVATGTASRPFQLSARGIGSLLVSKQLTVVATAYRAGGLTDTGVPAEPGVIAVDPSFIQLGTKLYIPGIGVVRAEDTGGAIKGNRIDICMGSESAAERWGVRTITIYIIQ